MNPPYGLTHTFRVRLLVAFWLCLSFFELDTSLLARYFGALSILTLPGLALKLSRVVVFGQ